MSRRLLASLGMTALAACHADAGGGSPVVVAPSVLGAPAPPAPPTQTAPAPAATAAPSAPAPGQDVFFFLATPDHRNMTASSKEGLNVGLDVAVWFHLVAGRAPLTGVGPGSERETVATRVFNDAREALNVTGADRAAVDLWGANRAEWVAAALARLQPHAERYGLAVERIELVAVRFPASFEQAARRSGLTPAP